MQGSRRDPAKCSGLKAMAWAKQQHCMNPMWHHPAQAATQPNSEAGGGRARHGQQRQHWEQHGEYELVE